MICWKLASSVQVTAASRTVAQEMEGFAVVPVSRPAASRSGSPGVPWIEPTRCHDVPRVRWPFLPALSSLTACTALAVSKGSLSRAGRRPEAQAKPRRRVALVEASRGKTSRTGARRGLHSAGPVLSTGTLPVGDGFDLYYEEHGSPNGIPVVFLHGGPRCRLLSTHGTAIRP